MYARVRRAVQVEGMSVPIAGYGDPAEERDIAGTLIKQMVDFIGIALAEMDPERPGVGLKEGHHVHDPDPCYPMAFLYKNPHPLNPYYRDKAIRDKEGNCG